MSLKNILRLICLLFICLLFAQQVTAQEGMSYTVTGTETVNGRECPRLTCAVVRRLEPRTIINVVATVSGDTVFGSDQWVQVNAEGVEMYVHTSLVAPAAAAALPENSSPSIPAIDTSDWVSVQADDFQLLTPEGWTDVADLITDKGFMGWVQQTFGDTEVEWYHETYESVQANTLDLAMFEVRANGVLYVWHESLDSGNISSRALQRIVEAFLLDMEGSEIVRSDLTTVPAGEAVRVEVNLPRLDGEFDMSFLYAVICDGEVHYLTLVTYQYDDREEYAGIADTIANNFVHNHSNL